MQGTFFQTRLYLFIPVIILLGLGLSACGGAVVISEGSPPPGANPQQIPGNPTPTWTLAPSLIAPTVGAPIPESVTAEEALNRLNPFDPVSSCTLPCLNGMTPGESGLQNALNFYARLGIGANDMVPGDYQQVSTTGTGHLEAWLTRSSDVVSAIEAGNTPPQVDIFVEDNGVEYVYVVWPTMPDYASPGIVLDNMGEPDELLLSLSFAADPPISIVQMVYAERRTGFSYIGVTGGDETQREVCFAPGSFESVVMGAFSAGQIPMTGISGGAVFQPLSSIGADYTQFMVIVKAGGCLMVPADSWSQWDN